MQAIKDYTERIEETEQTDIYSFYLLLNMEKIFGIFSSWVSKYLSSWVPGKHDEVINNSLDGLYLWKLNE